MKIAFVGAFEKHKGSEIFKELVNLLGPKHQWYIFGVIKDPAVMLKELSQPIVASHSYYWWDLSRVLHKYQIDTVLLLSLIPESFSLTFFESICAGVPVIAPKNGYPASKYPMYPYFIDLSRGVEELVKCIDKIERSSFSSTMKTIFRMKTRVEKEMIPVIREKFELVDACLKD